MPESNEIVNEAAKEITDRLSAWLDSRWEEIGSMCPDLNGADEELSCRRCRDGPADIRSDEDRVVCIQCGRWLSPVSFVPWKMYQGFAVEACPSGDGGVIRVHQSQSGRWSDWVQPPNWPFPTFELYKLEIVCSSCRFVTIKHIRVKEA